MTIKKKRKLTNRSDVSFGLIENVIVDYFSINQIDAVEERAGIYSWGYLPKNLNRNAEYFMNLKGMKSSVEGNFGIRYSGDLERESTIAASDVDALESDFEYYRNTLIAFSAPLYIGISNKLKTRLLTHRRQLNIYMDNPSTYHEGLTGCNSDSPEESSYFGYRVGQSMKDYGIGVDNLFVKCVYNDDYDATKRIEKVINRIVAPTYGMR